MERIVRRSVFTFSLHFSKFRFVSPFISAINFNNNTLLYRNFSQYDIDKSKEIHKNNVKTSSNVDNKVTNTSSSEVPKPTLLTVLIKQVSDPSFTSLRIPPTIEYVADISESALMKLKMQDISPSSVVLKDEKTNKVLDPAVSMTEALHQNLVYKGQKLIVSLPPSPTIVKTDTESVPKYTIDASMTNFANKIIPAAKIDSYMHGDIIQLENAVWLDIDSNTLFVRKFYSHVVVKIMQNFENPVNRRYIILGAPGISKSGFGNYLLYCAIKLKKSIVYANGKSKDVYFFRYDSSSDNYSVFSDDSLHAFYEVLKDRNIIFISDSMEFTPAKPPFTILITSPNISRWKTFESSHPLKTPILVFNPFTKVELFALRDTCFPNVSDAIVNQKFNRWGGSARATFDLAINDGAYFDRVLGAQAISLEILLNRGNLSLEQPPKDVVHRLLHFATSGFAKEKFDETLFTNPNFYEYAGVQPASTEVEKFFRNELNKLSMVALSKFIDVSSVEMFKIFLKDRGELFEIYASDILKGGGRYKCFRLGENSPHDEIIIPDIDPAKILRLNNLDELARNYKPTQQIQMIFGVQKSNFPTVDTIFSSIDNNDKNTLNFGNITVNMKHTILLGNANKSDDEAGGLLQILDTLKIDYTTTKIKFYWIVPQDIYYDWYKSRTSLSSFTIYDNKNSQYSISMDNLLSTMNSVDSVNSEDRVVVNKRSNEPSYVINRKYIDLVKNIEQYVTKVDFHH